MIDKQSLVVYVIAGSIALLVWLSPSWQTTEDAAAQSPLRPPGETERSRIDLHFLLNQPGPLWLAGVDLQGADLYGAQLSGANLYKANLQRAILNHADMTNANLALAMLQEAQLVQAQLDGADLALANLTRARLTGASLTKARLEGAALREATLTAAQFDGAHLSHIDLRGADLRRASLQRADLTVADLRGADLRGADLTGAVLVNANLEGANLQDATLAEIVYDAQTLWPAGFDPARPAMTARAPARSAEPPRRLRLEINLLPDTIPLFNQMAQLDDVARIDHLSDTRLLGEIRTGRRMAVFRSAALAEQLVPRLAGSLDIVAYNLEHSPTVPLADQLDPVAAAQRMRTLADRYGLDLAIGPDHDFVVSHGVQLAPYADQFVLQVQRVQEQPELVHSYVLSTTTALRQVNPAVEIVVQVRTDGDLDALVALLARLRPHMDGLAILASPDTTEFAAALWSQMRQGEVDQPLRGEAVSEAGLGATRSWGDAGRLLAGGILLQVAVLAIMLAMMWLLHRWLSLGQRSQPSQANLPLAQTNRRLQ